ncbi:MAG TPA: hypothetical protein VE757_06720 [Gaiellaceae bacterium]|nr:hypothetical protein [Gaiellaceae bacterium]
MRLAVALAAAALVATAHVEAAAPKFAACPRAADATRLPLRPGSHVLRGDVDGDGTRDRITIHYAKWARSSCAFLLTVETRHGVHTSIAPAYGKGIVESGYEHAREYPEPALGSLVRIREHGLVVMVALSHGASTVQVRPYWLAHGGLVRSRHDLTAWGSIAFNNQVNCYRGARSNRIVETNEWIVNDAATRWGFLRTIWRLTDRALVPVKKTTLRVGTKKAHALERRWYLGGRPFFSCTAAGGL